MKLRRLLVLLLAIVILAPSLTARAQNCVVVTWWGTERGRDTAATRQLHFDLARAFEKANPGIQVAVSLYPSKGFDNRIKAAIAAGQGPDIWYDFYSPDIASQGFLEDLTPYIKKDNVGTDWFPIGLKRAEYNDKFYGLPRDATSGFIAYNKDMFDAAKVAYPQDGWTVDDYLKLSKQLTDVNNDKYGSGSIEGGEGCYQWSPFSFNLGTDIVSPDGHKVVGYMDTPAAANVLKWCLGLVTDSNVAAPADLMSQFGEVTFMSGKVAMQSLSDWELPPLYAQHDFKWGVVGPPRFNSSTDQVAWTASYLYYMWSGSQHKDAAWQLMKYLTGPDAQKAESAVWPPNNPKT